MNRIVALNEDTDSDSSDEDNVQVTKEAEETIAVSEYMRALNFKKENKIEDALILFHGLLTTQILHEITSENKDNKLFFVKYNCYKNLGFIYMDQKDNVKALDHMLSAYELDDTDVFTMNKLGHLALSMNKLEVAIIVFEKCLKQNPYHWPAGDGILQALCLQENYNAAYGWALTWYTKDSGYKRGLDVILEIREKFSSLGFDYIENSWKIKFTDTHLKRTNLQSVFPGYSCVEPESIKKPAITEFRVDDLTWHSIGKLISNYFDKYRDDTTAVCYNFVLEDFYGTQEMENGLNNKSDAHENGSQKSPDSMDEDMDAVQPSSSNIIAVDDGNGVALQSTDNSSNSNCDGKFVAPLSGDVRSSAEQSGADDSETSTKPNGEPLTIEQPASSKPKPVRRRCSDLSFLEQWGWHKHRRYQHRKKSIDRNEPDTSINGILRRILAKYFKENFDNENPLIPEEMKENTNENAKKCSGENNKTCEMTLEQFQEDTTNEFQQLVNELKSRPFDPMRLTFIWIEHIAQFWNRKIPNELLDIYLNIYPYYLKHYDITAWNQLSFLEYNSVYDMMLFYVELYHDKAFSVAKQGVKNEYDPEWFQLYTHICVLLGFYSYEENTQERYKKCRKRIFWLQYCLASYEYDLNRAMNCLETISDQIINENDHNFSLTLPNLKQNSHIDLATIASIKITLQRTISINNVKSLYENEKFNELADILIDNLTNSSSKHDNNITDSSSNTNDLFTISLKITTQFEVLLEALWMTEQFEICSIWSERCLKYSLDKFIESPVHRQIEWAENVTFILTYIEALILNESVCITDCLGKYFSRLIQSITKIVVHQLDTPFDKNNNRLHAINTKFPWVILHHIIQREEDQNVIALRKSSITNGTVGVGTIIPSDREEIQHDDGIPCSIMIFFTAHEYLGLRSWCTKYDCQLLLYTLDIVATRLRSPYLEPFRDLIAEYLEQVTYCLYGYPAKRVRARHIEEHDATNIELTWDRAVQLFDLYRPDNLPEFNSYKNDSISADMEQLLQRIVNLMPKENDPSAHTTGIEEFIDGKSNELPEPINCLPYRINCIFYLLADYYFKTRDFAKSVRYYIMDLATCPIRFDAWAGLALSKTSKMETKLNSCGQLDKNEFLIESEDVLRCFRQCIELDKTQVPLWIEYGNFAYAVHSYYSRSLKQSSATLSMERFAFMEAKKDQCLKIASDCFTTVEQSTIRPNDDDENESHDEKWLYHYMLGKIAEKRKEQPEIFIDHYIKAAKCLYENNASYPFRICHSNPQNLSIEALEVYYRITSSIIKYIEQHSTITRQTGKFFLKTLKDVGSSPFAMNQAKIDDSIALKRKLSLVNEQEVMINAQKQLKADDDNVMEVVEPSISEPPTAIVAEQPVLITDDALVPNQEQPPPPPPPPPPKSVSPVADIVAQVSPAAISTTENLPSVTNTDPKITSPIRRGSQESAATTATTTTTTTGSDSTSSSSSSSESSNSGDSSSSDSDSDSSDDGQDKSTKPLKYHDLEIIFKTCIRNLEECVTRFPEHYKSIYRLVNIYLNAPDAIKDLRKCKQLLLSTYTTGLNNPIQGLFADRKNNNFFNGIWRIPSTEIDRPGSFSAHLSKCVIILMEVLRLSCDHRILLEFALQIQRSPDMDKRYIKDSERKELFQQAISFCIQTFRNLLQKHSREQRDDKELLTLLIEIYKAHKKSMKYLMHKEALFSTLLVDVYKVFMEGKYNRMPDSPTGAADYVIRLCQQEIVARTNQEKNGGAFLPGPLTMSLSQYGGMSMMMTTTTPLDMVMPNKPMTTDYSATANVVSMPSGYFTPQNVTTTVQNSMSTSSNAIVTSMITAPITSISTNTSSAVELSSTTTIPSVFATSASSASSYISGASRPRGRPPGSKNSVMPSTNLSSITANQFMPRMDPNLMAAMMGMYNNPSLMSSLAMQSNYTDPNTANSFLNEYMKLTGMLGNMPTSSYMPTSIPSATTTVTPSAKSSSNSIDASISAVAMAANKSSSSTVISVGSGQLTITPTLSTAPVSASSSTLLSSSSSSSLLKQSKDIVPNTFNNAYLAMLQAEADSRMLAQISAKSSKQPAVSVTKVPQQKSSPIPTSNQSQSSGISFPKSLPKSLTITPAPPAGYSAGKSLLLSNQTPQITLQPEIFLPPTSSSSNNDKLKKKSQKSVTATSVMNPFASAISMEDYNQQMALLNQYTEMMKGIASGSSGRSLSQLADITKVSTGVTSKVSQSSSSRSNNNKNKQSKSSRNPSASMSAVKQIQQHAAATSFSSGASAPLAHQQQKSKIHQSPSLSPKINSYSPLPPFAIPSSTSPISLSPSPNKSPILHHNIGGVTAGGSPSGHQISPTKTLQQKLAERQKALMDANKAENSRAAAEKSARQVSEVINID